MIGKSVHRVAVAALITVMGCERAEEPSVPHVATVAGVADAVKSHAVVRADRRAYDGAPPVIPHQNFGMSCIQCHNDRGMSVPGVGFAPPSPHELTPGLSAMANCKQCHVFRVDDSRFVESGFIGLRQDLRKGRRLNPLAPPVIPHAIQMRENCIACHSGPAAREELRCSHPDRTNCRQCHVEPIETSTFARADD